MSNDKKRKTTPQGGLERKLSLFFETKAILEFNNMRS